MSKEEAMKAYVQALTEKVPTWNQNPKLWYPDLALNIFLE